RARARRSSVTGTRPTPCRSGEQELAEPAPPRAPVPVSLGQPPRPRGPRSLRGALRSAEGVLRELGVRTARATAPGRTGRLGPLRGTWTRGHAPRAPRARPRARARDRPEA